MNTLQILRKSKDDVDVDMAERKAAASAMQDAFNPDPEDIENTVDETKRSTVRWTTTPFVSRTILSDNVGRKKTGSRRPTSLH